MDLYLIYQIHAIILTYQFPYPFILTQYVVDLSWYVPAQVYSIFINYVFMHKQV